ncbi:MAG TPA: site-2 protease family protein [Gemmatimonadales bacterium]|nr:site-2 protease family protein [Gemmatimonadales bacterium]
MKWSWRVGRIAGIDLYVHVTFLILVGWVALSHYLARRSGADALMGVGFILSLFAIVVLHELGHALTARRFGISTRDITLLPIGGVARLERMPEDPRQELLVALAGPAVNVGLAAILFLVLELGAGLAPFGEVMRVGGRFLDQLLWVNVSLAAFNLLPAFPMDGGRVLRALLAMRMEHVRATQIAAGIGQAMAVLFGFVGLFTNPFLVFIALFIWLGAAGEASMVQMRSALGGIPVQKAMITDFRALAPQDPLARAVDHVLAGFQQDFPVVEQGRVAGVLTRADLLSALARRGQEARVGEVMRRDIETAEPLEMLEGVLSRLQRRDCHTLPVVHNGQLVGLVTTDNLGELLMVEEALRNARHRS